MNIRTMNKIDAFFRVGTRKRPISVAFLSSTPTASRGSNSGQPKAPLDRDIASLTNGLKVRGFNTCIIAPGLNSAPRPGDEVLTLPVPEYKPIGAVNIVKTEDENGTLLYLLSKQDDPSSFAQPFHQGNLSVLEKHGPASLFNFALARTAQAIHESLLAREASGESLIVHGYDETAAAVYLLAKHSVLTVFTLRDPAYHTLIPEAMAVYGSFNIDPYYQLSHKVPLQAGRGFDATELALLHAGRVTVKSQAAARQMFTSKFGPEPGLHYGEVLAARARIRQACGILDNDNTAVDKYLRRIYLPLLRQAFAEDCE